MAGLVVAFCIAYFIVALLVFAAVARIADAVEAQNKHYGIGVPTAAEINKEEAA